MSDTNGDLREVRNKGVGGHHRAYRGRSDDWLTPPHLIDALGPFDLDPCASVRQPWRTAYKMWTECDPTGDWHGLVWCNPPYGPRTFDWLKKLADHGDGIALVFARTETAGFFREVWNRAGGLLFIEGRLHFHHPVTGKRAAFNSGGPSVLVGYGGGGVPATPRRGGR